MSSQPNPAPKYVFGPFDYDGASAELRKHGSRVRLQGQPLQILATLLDRAGEVVSREALQRELWASATNGDFEHGLNAAVNKLRQVLGDSAEQPRYIETLPGRGYRFVAPLRTPTFQVMEMPSLVREPASPQGGWWKWVAGLMALLAAMGLGYWLAPRQAPIAWKPSQFTIHPPAGFFLEGAGIRQSFAVSPDGGSIAFTAMDSSGIFSAFLQQLGSLDAKPVPDGKGAYTVFWSPDGQALLFSSRGQLRRVTVTAEGGMGMASQIVGPAIPYLGTAVPLSGQRLLVSSQNASAILSASGAPAQPTQTIYSWPQLLPDGKRFIYTQLDLKAGRHRARLALADGQDVGEEVVQADSRTMYTASTKSDGGYLLYLRAGTLLAQPFDLRAQKTTGAPVAIVRRVTSFRTPGSADFSVSGRGVLAYQTFVNRTQLTWVNREGLVLGPASAGDLSTKYARLSPDGRSVATTTYDVDRGEADLWIFEGTSGRRISSGPGNRHAPVWSPDGKKLVFFQPSGGPPRLFWQSIESGSQEEALPQSAFMIPTSWSPDGRFILYNNSGFPLLVNDSQSDIFAVDLARGRKLTPVIQTPFHEANAAFSPDSKWLAFTSNESGRVEIYLQAVEIGESIRVTGPRYPVSKNGAQALRWRGDTKELYYLAFDSRVYAVPLRLGATVTAGPAVPLFSISTEARAAIHETLGFDVSADGKRFVIPTVTSKEDPAIVVVQDWETLLLPKK